MVMRKKESEKDEIIIEDEGSSAVSELQKLREKLKKCQKERDEYLAGWQRARADFINAKNEEEKRREEYKKMVEESILLKFLDLADSFESAFNNPEWQKLEKNWKDGIKSIYNQLLSILNAHNISQIEALGNKFDPNLHEAAGEVEVRDKEQDGMVVEELRKGYRIGEKTLRPSLVKVGKYQS